MASIRNCFSKPVKKGRGSGLPRDQRIIIIITIIITIIIINITIIIIILV